MNEFIHERFLGKGSFGTVILVRRRADNQLYALKQISLANLPKEDREAQLTEIRILSQIYHPNVLQMYEAFVADGKINMVLEYSALGDLDGEIQLHVRRREPCSERRIWEVLLQVLAALRLLHSQQVLYRDLKQQNIMCFADGVVKLADFGVAKVLRPG